MKVALVASCGIAAAAVGAVGLPAESLKMSITDRSSSEMSGVRVAQAAPPAAEPGKPSADEQKAQRPQAAEPGKAPPADRTNGQAAPADQKAQAAADRDDDDDDDRRADGRDDDDRHRRRADADDRDDADD
jgi:hypothetical protein